MPLESLTQKRSRLVDPRPRWAIVKMNSYGSNDQTTKGMDYALIELSDSRLVLFGDRRDQLCKVFTEHRKLAGMVTPRWFDMGVWILPNAANGSTDGANDIIRKWLGDSASTVEYGIRDTGFSLIMDDVKFPTMARVTRVVDLSIGIAPYPSNPKYSGLIAFARMANGPEVSSYSIAFSALNKHIENAAHRIATAGNF